MPKPDMRFAEAVQRVLSEHENSLRSQRQRTGLAHSTVLNWMNGTKPQMEAVIQFAEGFGLDVNEWLALAGHHPIPAAPAFTNPRDWYKARLWEFDQVARKLGIPASDTLHGGGTIDWDELETARTAWAQFIERQQRRHPQHAAEIGKLLEGEDQ